MRIYHNQLPATLNKAMLPVWLVFGDEPWQKNDSLQAIKQAAIKQGFSEVILFSADDKFSWQQVSDEYQSMSLFASQRIIEIELTSLKIGDAGSKALLALSELFHPDVLLIIHGGKADAATANKKWFKTLTNLGCYLPLYDLDTRGLNQWLNTQARAKQLNLAPQATSLMIELFEGNLLALEQELEKLSLLFNHQIIQAEDLTEIVIKQAKFNPFQLIDALLVGDCARCISILDQLDQEGTAAAQIIWFLHKEIKQLGEMHELSRQKIAMPDIYKKYGIWEKRKPLYQTALQKTTLTSCHLALSRIIDVDLISKTTSEFNPFILLADVCISLFHAEKTQHFSLNYELG